MAIYVPAQDLSDVDGVVRLQLQEIDSLLESLEFDKAEQAIVRFEERVSEDQEGPIQALAVLYRVKWLFEQERDLPYASGRLTYAAEIFAQNGWKRYQAICLSYQGDILVDIGKYDQGREVLLRALKLSHLYPSDINLKLAIYHDLGHVFQIQGDFLAAKNYYERTISIADSIGQKNLTAGTHNNLGNVYHRLGDIPTAIKLHQTSIDLRRSTRKYDDTFNAHYNIASQYREQGDMTKAREYIEKGLLISQNIQNKEGLANGYNEMAILLREEGKLREALAYSKDEIEIRLEKDEYRNISSAYQVAASIYKEMGQLQEALEFQGKAVTFSMKTGENSQAAGANMGLAEIFWSLAEYSKSKEAAFIAYELSKEYKDLYTSVAASGLLADIYQREKKYALANQYLTDHIKLKDSLTNEAQMERASMLQLQYELENQKRELVAQQAQEALLLKSEIERRDTLLYTYLLGIGLLTIAITSLIISYGRKRRSTRIIAKKNQKLQELSTFKEGLTHMIAHEMKNALNIILGYAASDPHNKKMHSITQAGSLVHNLITNMLEVQLFEEAKVPLNLEPTRLSDIIKVAKEQTTMFLHMKQLQLEVSVNEESVINVDAHIMTRIIANLLTNAIKYSETGQTIWLEGRTVEHNGSKFFDISVRDRGPGISEKKLPHLFDKYWQVNRNSKGSDASTGLGLIFCKLATEAHGGTLAVKSKVNLGSTFIVCLPYEKVVAAGKVSTPSPKTSANVEPLLLMEEVGIIAPYQEELNSLEVYQVGELNKVFAELEKSGVSSRWFSEIRAAVHYGEEEKYRDLLKTLEAQKN